MVLEKEPDWERRGSHLYTPAERPDRFIREQVRPLFYRHTETGSEQREFKEIASERDFWRQSNNLVLSAVRITDVKISDWFPRAPGVYWSRSALRARDSVYSQPSFNDEILGEYVAPNSKESLVEKGGIGTVRLRPRRIDDEDCWLATALNGTQCHAGIPVALPVSLMARVGIPWGGRVTIEGRVRFLQDAGLDATASSVHHARPLIVFVDALEAAYTKPSNNHVIITPVALFESLGNRLRGRFEETMYAFVQCMAGSDSELGKPSAEFS